MIKKLIFFIFTKKNFDDILYHKKNENLANFSILNPESCMDLIFGFVLHVNHGRPISQDDD